ncbi:hypothetical protein GIB67_003207 [Kingdonia uniflora]|uniref:DUF8040 domain-containing protein n=1 Tax=Kingdonia uniflora TaxID=39325 RepID=A0A7J7LGQ5_9MAGN|nr:hypothetical protein GIB67_003207 [Kingdonia uniflora]
MYNTMRIDLDSFRSLVAHFRDIGLLKDNMNIDVEEKLAIFMHIIADKMSNRDVNSRFQHSAAITCKGCFNVEFILKCTNEIDHGGREGNLLSFASWENVRMRMFEEHQHEMTMADCKTIFDYLKK